MRAGNQAFVAVLDILHGQSAQAIDAERLAGERADNIAMHYAALDIIYSITAIRSRFDSREIAEKAAREGISRPGRINHFLERIGRGAEIGAIRAKEQRAVAALLHNDVFQAHVE